MVELLKPYIVAVWNGRNSDEMPNDVREVYEAGRFRQNHVNIALFVLDPSGRVRAAKVPDVHPPAFRFDPDEQGRDFKRQLDEMFATIEKPPASPARSSLTLPTFRGTGDFIGARIYLTFERNRIQHYRTPVVEAVRTTDALRTSLAYPSEKRILSASDLKPWLEQLYAPAVMDGMGDFREITGSFTLRSAGSDAHHRYAILSGEASFVLDDRARTSYVASLSVALKYAPATNDPVWLRGVGEMEFPRPSPPGQRPERVRTAIAIESISGTVTKK